jgi:hypothetical protein
MAAHAKEALVHRRMPTVACSENDNRALLDWSRERCPSRKLRAGGRVLCRPLGTVESVGKKISGGQISASCRPAPAARAAIALAASRPWRPVELGLVDFPMGTASAAWADTAGE